MELSKERQKISHLLRTRLYAMSLTSSDASDARPLSTTHDGTLMKATKPDLRRGGADVTDEDCLCLAELLES